ncbi:MAG: M4 family metallopeptidase [Ruminococcaceae bacterium]|nr:M4 family metallopeptidase [Oscillospiraceae bacterium]
MKNKRNFSNLICITLAILLILCVFPVFNTRVVAKESSYYSTLRDNLTNKNNSACGDGDYISFYPSKIHFSNNESITVSYYANSDSYITDVDYTIDGFEVISTVISPDDLKLITFELICISNSQDYNMLIDITLSSGEVLTSSLYAIKNECGVFISPFSVDAARQEYFTYAINSGLMTQEEYEKIWAEISREGMIINKISSNNMSEISSSDIGANSTFSATSEECSIFGLLLWEDDFGLKHPLRNIMIEIYDKEPIGSDLLGITYTDNSGFFNYDFKNPDNWIELENGGYDIFIRVYPGDSNAMVTMGTSDNLYYCESEVVENFPDGDMIYVGYVAPCDTDLGRAFQISQAIITARDYAKQMMGRTPSNVTVRYPYDNPEYVHECFYENSYNRISITGKNASLTGYPNAYASWDIIMHEYGHHVQYELGIINDGYGFEHYSNTDNAIRYGKDIGIKLAWNESWPTVFGIMAQHYYADCLTNIYTVCDTNYKAYNGANHSLEYDNVAKGEACEQSIMSVLWDLFDSNNDTNDTITLGHENWWAVTTGNQSKTFSDFIDYFYDEYPEYIDDIGANLSFYHMASSEPYLVNAGVVSVDTPPEFMWYARGGSNVFPNDSFILIFYNTVGNEVLRIPAEYEFGQEYDYYQVPDRYWEEILDMVGTSYSVAICSLKLTSSPATGPYISKRSEVFTKPIPSSNDIITTNINIGDDEPYKELDIYLSQGQLAKINITFASQGTRVIQTFGTKDTLMYLKDENGNLLAITEDEGYEYNCFLSYDFEANTSYTLEVEFYLGYETGNLKMLIVSSFYYSSYEEISMGGEALNTLSGALIDNKSIMIRYKLPYTQTIEITIQAAFLVDIYIIDPTTTSDMVLQSYLQWIDVVDGEEIYKTSVTFTVSPNIPYLMVLCPNDPLNDSGNFSLTLTKLSSQ